MTNSEMFALMASGMAQHFRRHGGRLYRLWGEPGRRAHDLRDGLPLQPVLVEALSIPNLAGR